MQIRLENISLSISCFSSPLQDRNNVFSKANMNDFRSFRGNIKEEFVILIRGVYFLWFGTNCGAQCPGIHREKISLKVIGDWNLTHKTDLKTPAKGFLDQIRTSRNVFRVVSLNFSNYQEIRALHTHAIVRPHTHRHKHANTHTAIVVTFTALVGAICRRNYPSNEV